MLGGCVAARLLYYWIRPQRPFEAYESLSSAERRRAKGMILRRRDEFLWGRCFLRQALAAELQKTPSELEVDNTEMGKPFIKDQPLSFSLSHSKNVYLLAISSEGSVGADLQFDRPRDYSRLARKIMGPEGYKSFQESATDGAFIRYWTVYEAVIKARGQSIFSGMEGALKLPTPLPDAGWIYLEGFGSVYVGCLPAGQRFAVAFPGPPTALKLLEFPAF